MTATCSISANGGIAMISLSDHTSSQARYTGCASTDILKSDYETGTCGWSGSASACSTANCCTTRTCGNAGTNGDGFAATSTAYSSSHCATSSGYGSLKSSGTACGSGSCTASDCCYRITCADTNGDGTENDPFAATSCNGYVLLTGSNL